MKYANQVGYTDVTPFEVVNKISEKTLEIREMAAVRSNPNADLGFALGGFVGTFHQQEKQEWKITSNYDYPIIRIRLGKKGWKDAYGNKYVLADSPRKFYDYNF